MKTLSEQVSLVGKIENISISELRSKPGEVFTQVDMGKIFTISKNGRIVAEIQKPEYFDLAALSVLRNLPSSY